MSIVADLHTHSTASDGADAPARVVERAAALGLKAIALTDHDTVDGIAEAVDAGRRLGVAVVSGCEMTSYIGKDEFHILGYFVDPANAALRAHCAWFATARAERARLIGERLAALGVPVDMDAVMAKADAGVIARPHIAEALLAAGHVATREEAFDKYLANGKPADVPKPGVLPRDVIALIRGAGGFAVLAHPALSPRDQLGFLPELMESGLVGVEVWHSAHPQHATDKVWAEADRLGLLKTGGSDCHGAGPGKKELLGQWGMDENAWRRFEGFARAR